MKYVVIWAKEEMNLAIKVKYEVCSNKEQADFLISTLRKLILRKDGNLVCLELYVLAEKLV